MYILKDNRLAFWDSLSNTIYSKLTKRSGTKLTEMLMLLSLIVIDDQAAPPTFNSNRTMNCTHFLIMAADYCCRLLDRLLLNRSLNRSLNRLLDRLLLLYFLLGCSWGLLL